MNLRQGFLLGLIFLVGAICTAMFWPFAPYIIAAAILGYLFQPAFNRMAPHLGDSVSAAVLVTLTVFATILPVIVTGAAVAGDVQNLLEENGESQATAIQDVERRLERITGTDLQLQQRISQGVEAAGSFFVGNVSSLIGFLTRIGIGLSMLLFVEFYAIRDGDRFVQWLYTFDVLPEDMERELFERTGDMTWAVVKGHILVAVVQGVIAGIGLFLVGIPNVMFWTFVMVLLGFVPIIGSAGVWMPAVAYLLLTGQVVSGLLLLAYGLTVVGLTDNFLRPYLVEDGNLHEVYILLGVVGGIFFFGAIGIFIGPVLFGVFKALLLLFRDNYHEL